MTIAELHKRFLEVGRISTDTRKIEPNSIFFALKGENFDGNKFAKTALEKGASLVIADDPKYTHHHNIILVDNSLKCLQRLANYHRNYSKSRIIALTGSNGKTTTKELIFEVLSKKYKTIATIGNLNNHIGVPLSLLRIKEDTELAIIEMGANHQKEIEFLAALAQPNFGYITNFGKAHLEGFGGVEGVIKGKSELYDYLMAEGQHIFLNADDPIQLEKLSSYVKKFGFSTENEHYFKIKLLGSEPFVSLAVEATEIHTQLIGNYNFANCAAAILIGKYFNVPMELIKEALENYVPQNNRSQLLEQKDFKIVLDAYNANPTSMEAALKNFKTMSDGYKILFLGDMFELGDSAMEEHQKIATMAENMGFDLVYLIGENFYKTSSSSKKFKTFDALSTFLQQQELPQGSILIKGSRGMALERILPLL